MGLILAIGPAGAGQKDLDADIDEILTQLLQLQREHSLLRNQLAGQTDHLQEALANRGEDERISQADQISRVDEIGREMEVLGQKLDDTNYRLSALSAEILMPSSSKSLS